MTLALCMYKGSLFLCIYLYVMDIIVESVHISRYGPSPCVHNVWVVIGLIELLCMPQGIPNWHGMAPDLRYGFLD